jgi:hypothetical protein
MADHELHINETEGLGVSGWGCMLAWPHHKIKPDADHVHHGKAFHMAMHVGQI